MLARRVLSAAVGLPVVVAVAWAGGVAQMLLAAAVAVLGARELAQLAGRHGWPARADVLAAVALGPLLATWLGAGPAEAAGVAVAAAFVAMAGWVLRRLGRTDPPPLRAAATLLPVVLAALWLGWPLALWIWLRHGAADAAAGFAATMQPLLITWAGDTAAYFAGLRWGRRRLAPAVSPAKSVEGALAGLAASTLAGGALGPALGWPTWLAGACGMAVGAAAQLGDLWESALKRDAGVKDTGGLLPGHGGVLDRIDSLLFALPLAVALHLALEGMGR